MSEDVRQANFEGAVTEARGWISTLVATRPVLETYQTKDLEEVKSHLLMVAQTIEAELQARYASDNPMDTGI